MASENIADWSYVTRPEQEPENFLANIPKSKSGRGRPPKKSPSTPTEQSVPVGTQTPPIGILKDSFAEPDYEKQAELLMSSLDLVEKERKRSASPKAPRGVSFAKKKEVPKKEPDTGRSVLLATYESYFADQNRRAKHSRKYIEWKEHNSCQEIQDETMLIIGEIENHNPAYKLGMTWAFIMGNIVEPAGHLAGYYTANLGEICNAQVKTGKTENLMSKLLIKYPKLRGWIECGNMPELELLALTYGAIRAVDEHNRKAPFQKERVPNPLNEFTSSAFTPSDETKH